MKDSFSEMKRARLGFVASAACPLVLMAVIHLVPKDPIYADPTRLVFTIVFFLSALWLIYAFTRPLELYLESRSAWRFEGAGPAIFMTIKKLEARYAAFAKLLGNIVTATVGAVALLVLSSWPAFAVLAPFRGIFQLASILGLAGAGFVLYRGRNHLTEVMDLQNQLRDQLAIDGFTPLSKGPTLELPLASREDVSPVTILAPGEFRAGDFDWRITDFYQNLIVFGKPGSGKTACVLNALLDGLVRSTVDLESRPAGLILDPKGDYKDKIRTVMKRAGREHDLIVFGPDDATSIHWNPFDTDDDALEVANRFGAVFDVLGRSDKDAHFVTQSKLFIQSCLTLIRQANPPDEPPEAKEIVMAMGSDDALKLLIELATARTDLTPEEKEWQEAALSYLGGTWMSLGGDERGSVVSTLTGALAPFLNPPYGTLMGGRSTIKLGDAIESGKVIYVDFSIARRGAMARIACTLLKAEYARQVLQREGKARTSFFFCDEFQQFFSSDKDASDADFFERSRGSNHANIVATQNYSALRKGRSDTHTADNLVANCGSVIFLRNIDVQTNEWASKVLTDRLEVTVTSSRGSSASSASYAPRVRPGDFMGLAQPEKGVSTYAEAISLISSRAEVVLNVGRRWHLHLLK